MKDEKIIDLNNDVKALDDSELIEVTGGSSVDYLLTHADSGVKYSTSKQSDTTSKFSVR